MTLAFEGKERCSIELLASYRRVAKQTENKYLGAGSFLSDKDDELANIPRRGNPTGICHVTERQIPGQQSGTHSVLSCWPQQEPHSAHDF
jgi:hypothetical protein